MSSILPESDSSEETLPCLLYHSTLDIPVPSHGLLGAFRDILRLSRRLDGLGGRFDGTSGATVLP